MSYYDDYVSYGDANFMDGGLLIADNGNGYYSFVKCDADPDGDDNYLFSVGEVDINADWIDDNAVKSYAGADRNIDPIRFVDGCISYYGAENFGESGWYSGYDLLMALSDYVGNIPEGLNFNGYSFKDAMQVYLEDANKKDYLQRVKDSINYTVRYNFDTLKSMIDDDSDLVMVEGMYFPRKAVKWIETADSYQDFHLNPNMDLTVANILSLVEEYDTIDDAVEGLFDEYDASSAYSWADNYIEVLKHLSTEDKWDTTSDFDDYDEWSDDDADVERW